MLVKGLIEVESSIVELTILATNSTDLFSLFLFTGNQAEIGEINNKEITIRIEYFIICFF